MGIVFIVAIMLLLLVVVALLVATPKIRERQGAAERFVVERLGGEGAVVKIDRMANGFGSEPSTGDDLRGPGVLGLGSSALVFALTPTSSMTIPRSDIVGVESTAEAGDTGKSMVKVTHRAGGEEVTTSWRLRDAAGWAEALRG